jgi:hypothetical protein
MMSFALLMYLGAVIGFAVYAVNLHVQAALRTCDLPLRRCARPGRPAKFS